MVRFGSTSHFIIFPHSFALMCNKRRQHKKAFEWIYENSHTDSHITIHRSKRKWKNKMNDREKKKKFRRYKFSSHLIQFLACIRTIFTAPSPLTFTRIYSRRQRYIIFRLCDCRVIWKKMVRNKQGDRQKRQNAWWNSSNSYA